MKGTSNEGLRKVESPDIDFLEWAPSGNFHHGPHSSVYCPSGCREMNGPSHCAGGVQMKGYGKLNPRTLIFLNGPLLGIKAPLKRENRQADFVERAPSPLRHAHFATTSGTKLTVEVNALKSFSDQGSSTDKLL